MPNRAGASSSRTRTGPRPTTDNPPPGDGRPPACVTTPWGRSRTGPVATDTTAVLWQPCLYLRYFVCKSKFAVTACKHSRQLAEVRDEVNPYASATGRQGSLVAGGGAGCPRGCATEPLGHADRVAANHKTGVPRQGAPGQHVTSTPCLRIRARLG